MSNIVSKTPRTDACMSAAQDLIRKYGTKEGAGAEFAKGNAYILARQFEMELAETRAKAIRETAERCVEICRNPAISRFGSASACMAADIIVREFLSKEDGK